MEALHYILWGTLYQEMEKLLALLFIILKGTIGCMETYRLLVSVYLFIFFTCVYFTARCNYGLFWCGRSHQMPIFRMILD